MSSPMRHGWMTGENVPVKAALDMRHEWAGENTPTKAAFDAWAQRVLDDARGVSTSSTSSTQRAQPTLPSLGNANARDYKETTTGKGETDEPRSSER